MEAKLVEIKRMDGYGYLNKIGEQSFYVIPQKGDHLSIKKDGCNHKYFVKYRIFDENGCIEAIVV